MCVRLMCVLKVLLHTLSYGFLNPLGKGKVGQDSICCLLNGHTDVPQDSEETESLSCFNHKDHFQNKT